MSSESVGHNELGQPVGFDLPGWTPPAALAREVLVGRCCRLEPLQIDVHAGQLFEALSLDVTGAGWTYLPYGPFRDQAAFEAWMSEACCGDDPFFYAIIDRGTSRAVGFAAYLRITPSAGSIEVGHVRFSPLLQRTPAATEAMYLMMRYAFELGYRRYEWKCDALNEPSFRAAERFGFTFEGTFRQATVYRGRNRDTAWFSILDTEWPRVRAEFERWLDPSNFDERGVQRTKLTTRL